MCLAEVPPKVKAGRPSLISRIFKPFTVKCDLDNSYHSNPDVIGRTTEEAKALGGKSRNVQSEEASQLRSEGSKCLTVWTQSEAYPLLSQWCESKGKPAPNGIASFLRFVGDGSEGLFGFMKFLTSSAPAATAGGAPVLDPATTHGCGPAEMRLKDQQIATQQATISELKKKWAKDRQELEKVKDAMAVLEARDRERRLQNATLRRSNTRMKNTKAKKTAEKRKLKRRLDTARKIISRECPQQRKRKDIFDLKQGGRAYCKRLKEMRRVLAPASVNLVRDNNKKEGLRKR